MSEQRADYGDHVGVEFVAEVRQIKTMADHTINITLNIPEYCTEQAKKLLDWLADEVKVIIVSPDSRKATGRK